MYEVNNKRKPKKSDSTNIMKCIVRAIEEHFHISSEFFSITKDSYIDYFRQLEELKYIRRVTDGEYIAENFNATLEGTKFLKRKPKKNVSVEAEINLGVVKAKVKIDQ